MAKLTAEQYAKKLRNQMKLLSKGEPLRVAAQTVHAMRVKRIFDDGSVSKGYNRTNPVYIENSKVRGGARNSGKTGRAKKTSYFSSYFDAKGQMGFDNSNVNFRLTNDLQMDFANSSIDPNTGKPNSGKVIKVNPNLFIESLRRPENQRKLAGLKKKYGDFTVFYENEKKEFFKVITFETNKLLRA